MTGLDPDSQISAPPVTNLPRLTLGFAVGLGLFTSLAAVTTGGWSVLLRILMLVCAVGIAIAAFIKSTHEERERARLTEAATSLSDELAAERQRNLTSVNGALLQSVGLVQALAAMSQNERLVKVAEARGQIVQAALDLVKCQNPRACYFKIKGAAGSRTMLAETHRARDRVDEPTTVFVEGDGVDQNVWAIVDGPTSIFVGDIQKDALEGFSHRGASRYQTFISVGVKAGGVPFGMLTINAIAPGDLDKQDEASMRVLARLLGTAEALGLGTTQMNRRRRA